MTQASTGVHEDVEEGLLELQRVARDERQVGRSSLRIETSFALARCSMKAIARSTAS
jgi:hypothetical protein